MSTMINNAVGNGADVYLAVYDLSGGMARNLSQQFLGVAIDIVPHTGLVVFGKEWFFGGGIQAAEPHAFRASSGLAPIQTIHLGRTKVNQTEFEQWCRPDGPGGRTFHPSSYDLLQRNCNHFSHEAALKGLKLPKGVPDWILDVPRKFVSSPMGQIVRPMLEQMQVTQRPAVHGHGATNVTSPLSVPTSTTRGAASTRTTRLSSSTTSSQQYTQGLGPQTNPWAKIPPSSSDPATLPSSVQTHGHPPALSLKTTGSTKSILNKYNVYMLSQDKASLPLCIKKISPYMTSTNNDDERIVKGWERLCCRVRRGSNKEQIENGVGADANDVDMTSDESIESMKIATTYLWTLLRNPDNNEGVGKLPMVILLLLRLIVLDNELFSWPSSLPSSSSSTPATTAVFDLDWMVEQMKYLQNDNDDDSRGELISRWKSPAARSMAWCVLSNAVSTLTVNPRSSGIMNIIESLIDVALIDQSPAQQSRVEVRQAASTFLYNVTLMLQQTSEQVKRDHGNGNDDDEIMDDTIVSILCSNLDGSMDDETDPATRLRRSLVVGRILSPIGQTEKNSSPTVNTTAKAVILDLGFGEFLKQETSKNNVQNEFTFLAQELLVLLE